MICVGTGNTIGSNPVVTVTDPATNSTTGTVALTIDNTTPSAPTILAPVTGSFAHTGTVSVSGTGEAGATVAVTDGTTSHSAVVDGSGNWSVIFTALSDGPMTFTAEQTDLAGNTSASSSTTIIVDTVAPVLIFTDDVVA